MAELLHGGAIFVQPACLCHLLRGTTSQPPLIAHMYLATPSRAQLQSPMSLQWNCWSQLKMFCMAFCRSGGF